MDETAQAAARQIARCLPIRSAPTGDATQAIAWEAFLLDFLLEAARFLVERCGEGAGPPAASRLRRRAARLARPGLNPLARLARRRAERALEQRYLGQMTLYGVTSGEVLDASVAALEGAGATPAVDEQLRWLRLAS